MRLSMSFGLPSRPRSLAKRDTKKEKERELDLRRQFIEKQGGVEWNIPGEPSALASVSFDIQLQMQSAKSSLSSDKT